MGWQSGLYPKQEVGRLLCREKNLHEREWRMIATEDKALKRRQKELPSEYEEFVSLRQRCRALGNGALISIGWTTQHLIYPRERSDCRRMTV